jgi:hypothetical protein
MESPMIRVITGRLAALATLAALAFGAVAVADSPSVAQIRVRCWKETCWTGQDGRTYCRVEEIPCPDTM